MQALRNLAFLLGRLMAAALFIYDAWVTVRSPGGAASYIDKVGLPGDALSLVLAAAMLIGGLLIVIGLWTRLAALAFAAFCIATATLFHYHTTDVGEMLQMGKDLAIAGGFLFLAAAGPGVYSLDARRGRGMI
ncbi:MAG TPA: DoxX family protein [Bauldia sp.]|nr:DoxX family protein [Bauldia sp.]